MIIRIMVLIYLIFKVQQFYSNPMSLHSNKYYHLVKALRIQKQQSQVNKALRERSSQIRIHEVKDKKVSCQQIASFIDQDHLLEMDDKDRKLTVEFNQDQNQLFQHIRLWVNFQKQSLTLTLSQNAMELQKKISQNKDEKLISAILSESELQKTKRQNKITQLNYELKEEEEIITKLKEKEIQIGLQLQGNEKEFMELKVNFQKEEKKINQRSSKYKQEKSKDIMIKHIDKEDMEMRKVMASKIKLNQQLDFGFQIQRRRAFNQAKQAINQKKKICQEKLSKLKATINQHNKKLSKIIQEKADLQKKNQILSKQMICFVKKIIKNFKNHSEGIQWLIKLLQEWKTTIRKQDFPDDISKEDARFISNIINEVKASNNSLRLRRQLFNQNTLKSNSKSRQYLKTQPNAIENIAKLNRASIERRKLQTKATVYFDIQNQNDSSFYVSQKPKSQANNFNINTKSLKKIYQNAGEVISNMIKNKSMAYNSCKAISYSDISQSLPNNLVERKIIEEKIKTKFINIRQKERRNNLKKLLFGQN